MLDLGIVIVNYNVRDLLRDCLASVFDSRGEFRFRGVRRGQRLARRQRRHGRSRVPPGAPHPRRKPGLRRGQQPGAAALWVCTESGTGIRDQEQRLPDTRYPFPYALLLNPDTVLPPSALADMLAFMEAHPQAGRGRSAAGARGWQPGQGLPPQLSHARGGLLPALGVEPPLPPQPALWPLQPHLPAARCDDRGGLGGGGLYAHPRRGRWPRLACWTSSTLCTPKTWISATEPSSGAGRCGTMPT